MFGNGVLLLLLCCSFVAGKQNIKLLDNGYEGLLISIDRSVDVSMAFEIIEGTKEYFTAASRALFTATNRRAYFRKIFILIPKEWIGVIDDTKEDPSAYPDLAHVYIAPPYDLFGNAPYVFQPGECGEAGYDLHLTPQYITDQRIALNYGHPGLTLVHEWGHLRWGLFDEYYININGEDNKYKNYYQQKDQYLPAKCSTSIHGSFRHRTKHTECFPESIPHPECIFYPSLTDLNANASLMFYHHLNPDEGFGFCDNNTDDPGSFHNAEAPNEHNDKCQGRSAWEIMREHEDFKNENNPPMKDGETPPDPVFSVVYPSRRRIVLVLDVSGSMKEVDGSDGMSRIQKLKKAASIYIHHTHPECQAVGIVSFNKRASKLHGIVNIDEESQQSLIKSLPTKPNGDTSIGAGLRLGLQLLKESDAGAEGGVLLVISDGDENELPHISSVQQDIKDNNVIVDVILYSPNADNDLITLADETSGMIRYEYGNSKEDSLQMALLKMVNYRSSCKEVDSYLLVQETISVKFNSTWDKIIIVDKGMSSLTCDLNYYSDGISTWTLEVESPEGKILKSSSGFKTYSNNPSTNVLSFAPADSQFQPGFWKIRVKNLNKKGFIGELSCTGLQAQDINFAQEFPINIDTYVGVPKKKGSEVNFSQGAWYDKRLLIRVSLMKHMSPVINATVKATVNYDSKSFEVILKDSGIGADVNADDGVYSAYFTKLPGNGKYGVNVHVFADNDQASIITVKHGSASPALSLAYLEGKEELAERVLVKTSAFQRVQSGGFFNVVNLQPEEDYYPPSRITDLTVGNVSYMEETVMITFTAPGDDLDSGIAASYIILYSTSYQFVNKSVLSNDHVLFGNISSPQPAGFLEQITLKLPKMDDGEAMVHLAVQVMDDSNQTSELSNKVTIHIPRDKEADVKFLMPLLIFIFVLIIVLITIGIILHYRKKYIRKYYPVQMGLNSCYCKTESQLPDL